MRDSEEGSYTVGRHDAIGIVGVRRSVGRSIEVLRSLFGGVEGVGSTCLALLGRGWRQVANVQYRKQSKQK